jgi:hypothetical protein
MPFASFLPLSSGPKNQVSPMHNKCIWIWEPQASVFSCLSWRHYWGQPKFALGR